MYVIAMNRLRGAYVDLDPGIERYFLASANDDIVEAQQTYYSFHPRGSGRVVFGSSMMIITVVTAAVAGLFIGGVAIGLNAPVWLAVVLGIIAGLALFVAALRRGYRMYLHVWRSHVPLRTSAAT